MPPSATGSLISLGRQLSPRTSRCLSFFLVDTPRRNGPVLEAPGRLQIPYPIEWVQRSTFAVREGSLRANVAIKAPRLGLLQPSPMGQLLLASHLDVFHFDASRRTGPAPRAPRRLQLPYPVLAVLRSTTAVREVFLGADAAFKAPRPNLLQPFLVGKRLSASHLNVGRY